MKYLRLYRFILINCLFFLANSAFSQVWIVDPMEAIYPDRNNLNNYNNSWTGDFTIGSNAEVHFLTKIALENKFTVDVLLDNEVLNIDCLNQLIVVPVEQNTGVDSRTEQYLGKVNKDVIRRAPFEIFEVIKPVKQENFISKTKFMAFRLSIPSNKISKKGSYKVHIKISSEAKVYKGVFTIKVHDVKLPKVSDSQFFYTNWFNLNKMEEHHHLDRWTEPWYKMLEKYAVIMAHGRQNSISLPSELITFENNKFQLDEERMLRFINVFKTHGFKYFEAAHLMYRGDNDDWSDPELKVALTKRRYDSENGKKDIEKLMTLIKEFTTTNGLTKNWLQHISDEPTSIQANCYQDVAKQIRGIYPEIKIMEATNDRDGLAGAVDIWCPLINDFQENESFFREREKLGDKVLVYTCLIPGGKWLNRTLDQEKLRQVYFGWGASFYNTGGYLHWGLNQYFADPFKQSVVKHHAPGAASNNFLPAGDTHIIYPGKEGPLSSIRFESHRVGIEDYDLLQLLKNQNTKLYNTLVNKIFRSYTDYNLNIKDYRKTKRKLIKALVN